LQTFFFLEVDGSPVFDHWWSKVKITGLHRPTENDTCSQHNLAQTYGWT